MHTSIPNQVTMRSGQSSSVAYYSAQYAHYPCTAVGYYTRVLRSTTTTFSEPPSFDEWGRLLVDGLAFVSIVFIYAFIPDTIVAIGGGLVGVASTQAAGAVASIDGLLGLAVYYVVPAGLATLARLWLSRCYSVPHRCCCSAYAGYVVAWADRWWCGQTGRARFALERAAFRRRRRL
jgi:hypothetical protein